MTVQVWFVLCCYRWAGKQNWCWNKETSASWPRRHVIGTRCRRRQWHELPTAVVKHAVGGVAAVAVDTDVGDVVVTLSRYADVVATPGPAGRRTPSERTRGSSLWRIWQDFEREVKRFVVTHQLKHQLPACDDMMILCSGSNRVKLGRHRFHRHYEIILSAVLSEIYIFKLIILKAMKGD